MPNKNVEDLIVRLIRVEERVKGLLSYQKWQMGMLALILGSLIVNKLTR